MEKMTVPLKLTRRRALWVSVVSLAHVPLVSACSGAAPGAPAITAPGPAPSPTATLAAPTSTPAGTPVTASAVATTAPTSANAVTLRVFYGANPEESATRQKIFDAYMAAHPSVKIEPELVPGGQTPTQKLLTDIAGGSPPDVAMAWELNYPGLATKGAYRELNSFIDADQDFKKNVLSDYYPSHIDMYTWRGHLYVLPEQNASVVLYYNTRLFSEANVEPPPSDWSTTTWTWDKFLTAAQTLTKKDSSGKVTQFGYVDAWWPPLSAVIFGYNNGGKWFDTYKDPTKVTITDPKFVQAFQFYADLAMKHHVAPTPEEAQAQAGPNVFMAGKAGMALVGHWFYPAFSKATDLTFDIGVFPVGPSGTHALTDLGGTGMTVVASGKHLDDAWSFLKFECGLDGQKIIARSGLFAPVLRSVANSDDFLKSHSRIKNVKVFNSAMENAVSFPIGLGWDAMADALGRDLQQLWTGKKTADDALKIAQADMQKALDDARTSS